MAIAVTSASFMPHWRWHLCEKGGDPLVDVIDLGPLEWTEDSGNDEYDSSAKGLCDPPEE